jgi:hypothetical protein
MRLGSRHGNRRGLPLVSHPPRQELQYLRGIKRARLGVDWLHRRREGGKLAGVNLGDFAALRQDRGARLFVFNFWI